MKLGIKKVITGIFLLTGFPTLAHHSVEHTMWQQNPDEVIAATQQGASGPWIFLIWLGVGLLLALGLWRWLKKSG